mgnify:CR=1 FL=1
MSISDDTGNESSTPWWPVLSALFMAGAGYLVLVRGLGSLPPFIALLLIGAVAIVLHRLIEMLRSVFDNIVVRAFSATALMLSMLAGILAASWALTTILIAEPNPMERWQAASDTTQAISAGLLLFTGLLLIVLAIYQAITLWRFVRANAFGPHSSPLAGEDEGEARG